ncbi:hypothetical protein [Sphaerotilus sp.]|uniref:hypothetical protein n=1 Tax=Sphaerotilus sp. TaxID=2093942 RepID=UPI002ACE3382|nr:hypothetical protein [Sphaerotilus sp.]MDZ7855923.1 hypothetical protein [Sphaerotilus sp.]
MGSIDGLSEVQMANLCLLMTIRDCVLKNAVAACCQFGIAEDLGQLVTALSHAQIFSIIVNLGNECLFLPRQNLSQLLSLPLPLLAPLFAVHPPRPAPLPEASEALASTTNQAPQSRSAT